MLKRLRWPVARAIRQTSLTVRRYIASAYRAPDEICRETEERGYASSDETVSVSISRFEESSSIPVEIDKY